MARKEKYQQAEFHPKNPAKYTGKYPIVYRSSWEAKVMEKFDRHPNVLRWESETTKIPYINPMTGKWTYYIPDFVVVYIDKDGKQHAEMLEVKPLKEIPGFGADGKIRVSQKTKQIQKINYAKWAAAVQFCAKYGIRFRLLSEVQIFGYFK